MLAPAPAPLLAPAQGRSFAPVPGPLPDPAQTLVLAPAPGNDSSGNSPSEQRSSSQDGDVHKAGIPIGAIAGAAAGGVLAILLGLAHIWHA